MQASYKYHIQRIFRGLFYRIKRLGKKEPVSPMHLLDGTLSIGEYSYGMPNILKYRGDNNRVKIGKFCSIAAEVTIFVGGNHPTTWISTYPFRRKFDLPGQLEDGHPQSKGDVVIGPDVWIGYGTTILSGVTVGAGAIIAARSVVTKDVSPYHVVGGNPAKMIRARFSDQQIEDLLAIAWWDWSVEKILTAVDDLNADNIDIFIERCNHGYYDLPILHK